MPEQVISLSLKHDIAKTKKGTVKLSLKVEATGMPSEVFAIEVLPKSADKYAPTARFSHICSPAELVEFPAVEAGENCYYRINEMEMIFDSSTNAELVLANIKADLTKLVKELKAAPESVISGVFTL